MKSRFWPLVASLLLGLAVFSQASQAGTVCDSDEVIKYLPPLPRGCQTRRIEATGGLSFGIILSPQRRAEAAWQRQVVFFYGERYQDWNKAACKKVFCVHASIAGSRRCIYSAFPCSADIDTKLLDALNAEQPAAPEPHDEARTAPGLKQRHDETLAAPGIEPRHDDALTAPEIKQHREEAQTAPEIKQPREEALTPAEIREMQELLAKAGYRVLPDGVFGDRTKNALTRWQQRRGLPENGTASRENLEKLRRMPAAAATGVKPWRGAGRYRLRKIARLRWRRPHFARHSGPAMRGASISAPSIQAKWRRPKRAFGAPLTINGFFYCPPRFTH